MTILVNSPMRDLQTGNTNSLLVFIPSAFMTSINEAIISMCHLRRFARRTRRFLYASAFSDSTFEAKVDQLHYY